MLQHTYWMDAPFNLDDWLNIFFVPLHITLVQCTEMFGWECVSLWMHMYAPHYIYNGFNRLFDTGKCYTPGHVVFIHFNAYILVYKLFHCFCSAHVLILVLLQSLSCSLAHFSKFLSQDAENTQIWIHILWWLLFKKKKHIKWFSHYIH